MPPPPGLVVGVVVVGGVVVGGAVAGGLVAGGVAAGGVAGRGVAIVFAVAGDGVTAGAWAVFAVAGGVVVVFVGAGAGANVDEGLVVAEVVVVDGFTRVDVVAGELAPEDEQAVRSRPPATTIPSDRTLRVMQILLLVRGAARCRARAMYR